MNKDKLNVLYLGYSGFPYGLAELQKILLISKALVLEGTRVTVLGSRGNHNRELHPDLKKAGHFNGIIYIYSSCTPFRSHNRLKRNIKKPFEKILEFFVIYRLNKKDKIDAAIVSTMNFSHLLFYKILSKIFGFKIILNFVEYNSSLSGRDKIRQRVNDYFFDRYSVKVSNGVLVISEFLIKVIKKTDPHKVYLKIPMMVDIDRYNGIFKSCDENYFLFCGAAEYKEIIFFIINSFEIIENDNTFLYLVINGNNEQISEIEKRIVISGKSKVIRLFSRLTDKELSVLYKNAMGLLIPLRPTIQDEARFPHKFGEYLASGNPVITTNYGEVKYYLKDMVNALIAESYDEQAFAEKLNYVILNPSECSRIGEEGKKIALEHADYRKYGIRIVSFINEIISKSPAKDNVIKN